MGNEENTDFKPLQTAPLPMAPQAACGLAHTPDPLADDAPC